MEGQGVDWFLLLKMLTFSLRCSIFWVDVWFALAARPSLLKLIRSALSSLQPAAVTVSSLSVVVKTRDLCQNFNKSIKEASGEPCGITGLNL